MKKLRLKEVIQLALYHETMKQDFFSNYLFIQNLNKFRHDLNVLFANLLEAKWPPHFSTHSLCLVKYKYLVFSKNDKRLQVNCLYLLSKRIWYPIVWPILSLLSAATLSATAIAANRLGWVQNIRQGIPFLKQSSKRNWGIWNKF